MQKQTAKKTEGIIEKSPGNIRSDKRYDCVKINTKKQRGYYHYFIRNQNDVTKMQEKNVILFWP